MASLLAQGTLTEAKKLIKNPKQSAVKREGEHLQKLSMVILNFNFEIQIVLFHHNGFSSFWQKGMRANVLCKCW